MVTTASAKPTNGGRMKNTRSRTAARTASEARATTIASASRKTLHTVSLAETPAGQDEDSRDCGKTDIADTITIARLCPETSKEPQTLVCARPCAA